MQKVRHMLRWFARPWPSRESSERPRGDLAFEVVFFLVIAVLGGLTGVLLVEPWKPRPEPITSAFVGELEVETGAGLSAGVFRHLRQRLTGLATLQGPGFEHQTRWVDLGAAADLPSLKRVLEGLARPASVLNRYLHEEGHSGRPVHIPVPLSLERSSAVESLVELKEVIDRRPQSARFDFKKGTVVPDVDGRRLDVYATLDVLDRALQDGRDDVEMVVEEVAAPITKTQLAKIDATWVLGFFETPYSRMRKDADRTHNLRLGASRLDGEIIMPGQVFSFNDALGDRSEAKGFRYAPVIAGGVVVEGMGGGTCQVASTLYAASFFAGLVIRERQPHSRPSSYIKLGLDATVSYPNLDLKIENPFDFPIVVHFAMNDGLLRAEIRGRERPYTVTLLRRIVRTSPYPVKVVDDPKLPEGVELVTQNGIPGYWVRRYQILERDKVAYRFETLDKYPPTTQFVHKGTAPKGVTSPDAPKSDNHSPYRAKPALRMVQGPNDLWYEQSHE